MCKTEKITLIYVKKGKTSIKAMEKSRMVDLFAGVAKGFSDDNEMSIKLIDIIKKAEILRFNKDIAESKDEPFIAYKIDGAVNTLNIKRHHKIVWAILERFFTE